MTTRNDGARPSTGVWKPAILTLSLLLSALQAGCSSSQNGLSCDNAFPAGAKCSTDSGCGAGATCDTSNGTCVCAKCSPKELAKGLHVYALAVDDTNVYWSDWDELWKVPRDGGPSTEVVKLPTSDDDDIVISLAVDESAVYIGWLSQDGDAVLRQPLDGGPLKVLASGQSGPGSIVFDATHVYWVNFGDGHGKGGAVMKALKSGGAPTVIAEVQSPYAVAVYGDDVYWADFGDADGKGGAVMKAPKSGGAPVVVAADQGGPAELVADERGLFWVNSVAGTVMKLPFVCGAPVTLASGQDEPRGLAVDANFAYWAGDAGHVWRVPLDGGPAVRISDSETNSRRGPIVTDKTGVYWASRGVAKLSN